jgi:hypothetical protein
MGAAEHVETPGRAPVARAGECMSCWRISGRGGGVGGWGSNGSRTTLDYRGTSLTRKRTPLGPYRRPMPRALGDFQGG